jgi:DNA-binding transcriptional ArsR family regulator
MPDDLDVARLAEHLKALGNANRLELLRALRTPRSAGEIELRPEVVRVGENPERTISHQAVRDHLAKLRAIGVLAIQRNERPNGIVDEYVLNHAKLFAIVEELRGLGELRAEEGAPTLDATIAGPRGAVDAPEEGPRFLLVRGQREGRVFPLTKEARSPDRGWILGRRRGVAVSLDYDPFVSGENAEVVPAGDGFALVDIRSSRNGTLLNFKRLPRGGSAPLANGDVVSVGRTSLVFRVG